jgi:hypothetical protein
MSINNPDIIILGGLDDVVTTETAADISIQTPPPEVDVITLKKQYFAIGAVVGAVLGAIGTYIAVQR